MLVFRNLGNVASPFPISRGFVVPRSERLLRSVRVKARKKYRYGRQSLFANYPDEAVNGLL